MNRITTWVTAAAVVAGPMALAVTAVTAHAAPGSAGRAAAYTVTAKVNKQVVTVGEDVVKVRGKVTPRAAGDMVVLQQRLDGKKKWKRSGEARIKASGRFVLKDEPSVAGSREYRVLKPAGDGLRTGTSQALEVIVYSWDKLGQRMSGAAANTNAYSTALIGTRAYSNSLTPITPGQPAYIEYTLGRLCTDLRTTYALTDSSATGSSGRITLALDGVTKVDQALTVGQVVESTTDLTNVFRLRYELFSNASPVSVPAVATPEVRCTR
jgi:hypothetical protein